MAFAYRAETARGVPLADEMNLHMGWTLVAGSCRRQVSQRDPRAGGGTPVTITSRQWGPMIKFHARLFTTGPVRSPPTRIWSANGEQAPATTVESAGTTPCSGAITARADSPLRWTRSCAPCRTQFSSTVSVVQSPSPFTHLFKQCTNEIVDGSGRVAYITRPGP
jgi:hypothetical protein